MSHEHNMTEHYDYIILGSGITGLFAVPQRRVHQLNVIASTYA